jgi:endoglycosylceramidase
LSRLLRPALMAALAVGLAALTYPGADLAALAVRPAPVSVAKGGAPAWLHVAHPSAALPYIADPEGRRVILRGAVSGGLVDYWSGVDNRLLYPPPFHPIDAAAYLGGRCPANSAMVWQPPLCRNDLSQMAALGFDVLRLALSWSLLEPEPGHYNRQYLDRIAQVVGWAREEGIYVILDMHENAYSRYLPRPVPPPLPGGSPTSLNQLTGAPAWAVLSDGLPSEVYLGQREFNPAVGAAFTSFWLNARVDAPAGEAPGVGLQDHYIGALTTLARRFAADSAVVGYGLFNEPWPGFVAPPLFEDLMLFPFYRRVADALTGAGDGLGCPASMPALPPCGYPDLGVHDRRHLLFFEPDHLREQTDLLTHLPMTISSYANLVYSIHAYTHKFTLDALAGQDPRQAGYPPGGFELSYASAEKEARAASAALFVTEFGNEPQQDGLLLAGQLGEQERHQTGATIWPWKENCTLTTSWGVYEGVYSGRSDQRCAYDQPVADVSPKPENGCLRAGRERLLARVWPRATAGRLESFAYDAGTGGFDLRASAPARAAETIVFIPRQVAGAPSVSGAAAVRATDLQADGSRVLHVTPLGGEYRVTVTPAPLALTPCQPAIAAR